MSASHGESIGMMNEAYFVSRTDLLNWLNDLLKLNYTKVEQACTGAAHCQIMDALYPGKVPLHKVNFNAKFDYEYVKNYKVLQDVFTKLNVNKHIDVNKLIKGKYQDNLEFLQWMKRYYDLHSSGAEYDAVGRRNAAIGASALPSAASTTSAPAAGPTRPSLSKAPAASGSTPSTAPKKQPSGSALTGQAGVPTVPSAGKVRELTEQVASLKLTVDSLERERDFYFTKLRDIEILTQNAEDQNSPIIKEIQKILYATEEEFIVPSTEENAGDCMDTQ